MMQDRLSRIAFLGTGIMGAPMARNLAVAGHQVTAWNRTSSKAGQLGAGIAVADDPIEACREADFIILMLSTGPVCDDVLVGQGLLAQLRTGSTVIVMSSVPVETARRQAEIAFSHGVHYLDAPVSGGEVGADQANLSIMVGGEEETFQRASSIFVAMGRAVHVGPHGAGQLSKLANQIVVACNLSALAEALTLVERGGANPEKVLEALAGGFADSQIRRVQGPRMISEDFRPGGPAKYQLKDTSTALKFARSHALDLPLVQTVDALYTGMVDAGDGDLDHSAIIRHVRRRNGMSPSRFSEPD